MADKETLYFGGTTAYISVKTQSAWAPIANSVPTAPTLGTKKVLAVVQGWEFAFSFEYKELYGMDSIKRVKVARCNGQGEGTIEYCKFDPTVATYWLFQALNPDGTASDGEVEDTNRMKFFEFKGSVAPFELSGTDTTYITGVTMTNARFEDLSFGGQKNEWYKQQIRFKATYVEFTNDTAS